MSNNAVAGNSNGQYVGGASTGNSTDGVRVANFSCNVTVGASLTRWNLLQGSPDLLLKDRAADIQIQDLGNLTGIDQGDYLLKLRS